MYDVTPGQAWVCEGSGASLIYYILETELSVDGRNDVYRYFVFNNDDSFDPLKIWTAHLTIRREDQFQDGRGRSFASLWRRIA